jgi:selenocysteine lyase/cysteine desulfurase
MSLDRKTFLRRATLGAAGMVAAPALRADPAGRGDAAEFTTSYDAAEPERFWRAVRAQYSHSGDLTYFNTGGLGPACQSALAAVNETTKRLQTRVDHGHALLADPRATVARFLGAAEREIAFVRNATEGNAIVAAGLRLERGDEVIFESHAHPGGSFPWLQQQALRGLVVKVFEPDPRDPKGNVERIAALLTRRTKVVQVSHVTAPTGIVMPCAEIAALCRDRRVWFHVDAAQSVGMLPVAVRELGCDSLATSGHKWIGGPLETGVLFVRVDRLEDVKPTLVGAHSGDAESLPGELKLADSAMRYEYGTRNAAAVVGLAAAMRFQERVGRDRIAARGKSLATHIAEGLGRLREIEVLTPKSDALRASMVTFRSARVSHDVLFTRLLKEHAMRCRPVTEQGLNAVRVSTHCFNFPEEGERLVRAVAQIVEAV